MTPAIVKPQLSEASMTREERLNLILAFARALYINGNLRSRPWPSPNA
jgi:hypothetical protein